METHAAARGCTPRSRMCDSCPPPASPPPHDVRPAACAAPAAFQFPSSAAQRLAAFEWTSRPRRCSAPAVPCPGPSWTRCQRLRRQLAQSSLCEAGETAVMLKQRKATRVGRPMVPGPVGNPAIVLHGQLGQTQCHTLCMLWSQSLPFSCFPRPVPLQPMS